MTKVCCGVIWVCLILGLAPQAGAQDSHDFNEYVIDRTPFEDLSWALSPAWNPSPSDTTHGPITGYVQKFGTCQWTFYYNAQTGRTIPMSVGMAARQYSGCFANYMRLQIDGWPFSATHPFQILGDNVNYSLMSGIVSYEWEARSECRIADPVRPWNAFINVVYEHNNGCH